MMLREPEYIIEINEKMMDLQGIIDDAGDSLVSNLEERPDNLKDVLTERCKEAQVSEELIIEMSVGALIRYQPFASDLRALTVAMKVAYDLSRVCRYIRNIGEVMEDLGVDARSEPDVLSLIKDARTMVGIALEAYFSKDAKLAMRVIKDDDYIDDRYRTILRKYAVRRDLPGSVMLFIGITARIAERMADHAVYISQEVIYLTTGRREGYR